PRSPICRSVPAVGTVFFPIVIVPDADDDARHRAASSAPSAASISGASTGQRSKGAQCPASVDSTPPATSASAAVAGLVIVAVTNAAAASTPPTSAPRLGPGRRAEPPVLLGLIANTPL